MVIPIVLDYIMVDHSDFMFTFVYILQLDILRKALYIHYLFSYDVMINTLKQHYKLYLVGDVTSFDTFLVDMRMRQV